MLEMAQQWTRSRPMVHFTVMLDGLTEGDVVEVERCLTSARVAKPGLATHPFNRQIRQARDRQLRGTFKFEFPCPDEPCCGFVHRKATGRKFITLTAETWDLDLG